MIQKQFENYLTNLGINAKSHKNYRSDLNHFLNFAKKETLEECIPFLSNEFAHLYKQAMIDSKSATKTINRRLSTLRKLAKFLMSIEAIDIDFAQGITNIGVSLKPTTQVTDFEKILDNYKSHLLASKVSKNTIKNYLSDTRHFLSWIANKN